jgi:hypothetical protein
MKRALQRHRILLLPGTILHHHLADLAQPLRLARVPPNRPHRGRELKGQLAQVQGDKRRGRQHHRRQVKQRE